MTADLRPLRLLPEQSPASPECVSPELVLVDPELAAAARAALPEPSDVTAGLEPSRVRVPHAARVRVAETAVEIAPETHRRRPERPPAPPRKRSAWGGRGRIGIVAASLGLVGGFALGVSSQPSGEPGRPLRAVAALNVDMNVSARDAPRPQPPHLLSRPKAKVVARRARPQPAPRVSKPAVKVSKPAVKVAGPTASRPKAAPHTSNPPAHRGLVRPRPLALAWARAPDADGYQVDLFRGSVLVYRANTIAPRHTVPARWRSGGTSEIPVPRNLSMDRLAASRRPKGATSRRQRPPRCPTSEVAREVAHPTIQRPHEPTARGRVPRTGGNRPEQTRR